MNAKVMLVCDMDIMEIDVSNMTTLVCETILIATIVSDWNTRAWTFFEAFRARRNIHLLCKNNSVVSLQRVIQAINRRGMLDIGILLLAAPHFLPPLDDHILASPKTRGQKRIEFQAGYLPIETSSNLLSHRPASRPGDDVVIWSLLISKGTVFYDAETFWKAAQGPVLQLSKLTGEVVSEGARIRTGYLVSNAPRLKIKGLGWAPATPTFRFSTHSATEGLNAFDDGDSARGYVTPEGLVADWLLWKFDNTDFGQLLDRRCLSNLAKIKMHFLEGYRWGAILRPIEERFTENTNRWWQEGVRMRRTIVVVCGTNELDGPVVEKYTSTIIAGHIKWEENREVKGWEWKGVYAWEDAEPLPEWKRAKDLLIV